MKTIAHIFLSAALLCGSDSNKLRDKSVERGIREMAAWNQKYQKLASQARIAAMRRDALFESKTRDCQSKGQMLLMMQDGHFDCKSQQPPSPPQQQTPPAPQK